MIIAKEIRTVYDNYFPLYERLGTIVNSTLSNYCSKKSYPFVSRYKTIESVAEKIESGRYKSWDEMDDIYACTIIIPNLNDEFYVIKDLTKYYSFQKIINRENTSKPPDVFRFDTTRIIAKLKDFTDSKPVATIPFEIQIKSAFEYAWGITTHSLTYKSPNPEWKRYRLTALLKAAVEQLDTLVLGFEDMSSKIQESYHEDFVNKSQIAKYLSDLFERKILPDEYYPKDLSRNCDNMLKLLHACRWYNKEKDRDKIKYIMNYFEFSLNQMPHVPRSLSLFQLLFCCLVQGNLISRISSTYVPVITEEMKFFFPDVKKYLNQFEFEKIVA